MVVIIFLYHNKIHIFPKLDICSWKIDKIRANYVPKQKCAWQLYSLGHPPHLLEKCVFSEAKQMILIQFFDIFCCFWMILEKPILYFKFRPQHGKKCPKLPGCGLKWTDKNGFSKIAEFGLAIPKNGTNIIWTSIKNTYFFKVARPRLKNWAYHTHLKFRIEMGVAWSIFELRPNNFGKKFIFQRCLNDITMVL